MTYQDLKRVNEAPKSGQLLAYTRKEVYFQPYGSLAEAEGLLQEKTLLELHLFDNDKEYRAIVTRSKRFPDGMAATAFPRYANASTFRITSCIFLLTLLFGFNGLRLPPSWLSAIVSRRF